VDPNITQCAQHLGIAMMKFAEYVPEAIRFEQQVRVGNMMGSLTEEDLATDAELLDGARHTQHRAQELWREVWEHLDGAREVAARLGRDTTMYDETRALTRKYGSGATLEVGEWTRSSGNVFTRTVEREVGPPKLIQHALDVLRAIVPEAEPPAQRLDEVPDLGSSKLGLRIVAVIGIAVVIALAVAWYQATH
jgi:hypothetical protein